MVKSNTIYKTIYKYGLQQKFWVLPCQVWWKGGFSSPPVVAAAAPPAMALQLFYVGMEATNELIGCMCVYIYMYIYMYIYVYIYVYI